MIRFFKCQMSNAKCLATLLLASSLTPFPAAAQGSAPGMFGVQEILIQIPHFGNDQTAEECGLDPTPLSDIIEKTLQEKTVPAISVAEAKPSVMGVARINLVADIFSFNSQGLDCTSWVMLSAESRNTLRIPPVDTSRSVTISYWREGMMLGSSQTSHQSAVMDAFRKLALNFAKQYKLDQPPPVPKE